MGRLKIGFGPASILLVAGFLLVMTAVLTRFNDISSINQRMCEASVANREATRGVWEGARTLSLNQAEGPVERFAINRFFDDVLRPYPPLQCVNQKPVPVLAFISVARKKPDPQPEHGKDRSPQQAPCLPFLPINCPPPPSEPPRSAPPAGDDPPRLGEIYIHTIWPKKLSIAWDTASDDRGLVGFRLYREGIFRALAGPKARMARFWFPCGGHVYAIEAVDSAGQRRARNIGIIRACRQ